MYSVHTLARNRVIDCNGMSTVCAVVAKISDPRFRELLPAPGELRAEEVDAAGVPPDKSRADPAIASA